MSGAQKKRRGQWERREATQASLLSSARGLFGAHGYAKTSLEDIAADCRLTVAPIYHYYKSKLGLFSAVIEQIEAELVSEIEVREDADSMDVLSGFMNRCEDPYFRQIILIDGPALLGNRRMMDGPVTKALRKNSAQIFGRKPDGLSMTMLMAALSSAALYIAENGAERDDYDKIRDLIEYHSNSPAAK